MPENLTHQLLSSNWILHGNKICYCVKIGKCWFGSDYFNIEQLSWGRPVLSNWNWLILTS